MTQANSLASLGSPGVSTGFKNRFINGGMVVGQRGNVVITGTNNLYGWVDRWLVSVSGTTVSALGYQASGLGSATNTGYALQVGNVNTTGTTGVSIQQRIESVNCFDLNSSTITISGKLMQQTGSTLTALLTLQKANAKDNFNGGQTLLSSTSVSVPHNTWTPFSWTVTLGATDASNGLSFGAGYSPIGAQSNTQFYFADMQLEKGTAATSFEYRDYGRELMMCQRYYEKSFSQGTAPNYIGVGMKQIAPMAAWASAYGQTQIYFKVTKRTTPTMTPYGNASGYLGYTSNGVLPTTEGGTNYNAALTVNGYDDVSFAVSNNVAQAVLFNIWGGWAASAEL